MTTTDPTGGSTRDFRVSDRDIRVMDTLAARLQERGEEVAAVFRQTKQTLTEARDQARADLVKALQEVDRLKNELDGRPTQAQLADAEERLRQAQASLETANTRITELEEAMTQDRISLAHATESVLDQVDPLFDRLLQEARE
jgi:hypothetical protein